MDVRLGTTIGDARAGRDHITAVDGLRAVSVLAVLIYHLDPTRLPGGFLGVDVFFAISGFVVARSMARHGDLPLVPFAMRFYRRRILRVVPATALFVVVLMTLGTLLLPVSALSRANDLVGFLALLGLGNAALWYVAGDYFSPTTAFNPFTHTWSLGVEEQFYVLFPLMGLLLFRASTLRAGLGLFVMLGALSLASSAALMAQDQAFAYYMLPARLWEPLTGVLLFAALGVPAVRAALNRLAVPWAGAGALQAAAVAMLALAFALGQPARVPFPWALVPVLATVILLALFAVGSGTLVDRALSWQPLVYIGTISFGLYLWHFGIIVLMRWTVGIGTAAERAVAVAAAFALAAVSHALVERPIRFSARLASRPDEVVIAGGVLGIAAAAAFIVSLYIARPWISLSVVTREASVWDYRAPDWLDEAGCRVERVREDRYGAYVVRFAPRDCAATGSPRRMAVIGDSHGTAYETLLQHVAALDRRPVIIFQKPGCEWLSVARGVSDQDRRDCPPFQSAALAEVSAELGAGDLLFLPGLRVPRFRDQWDAPVTENSHLDLSPRPGDIAEAEAALAALTPLIRRGARVVVEAPKPVFRTAPFRCADWFTRHNPYCAPGFEVTRRDIEARRARPMRVIEALRAMSPAISVWDPLPVLCPLDVCSAFRGRRPLFFDGDHLSGYGNDVLLPDFRAHLAQGADHQFPR